MSEPASPAAAPLRRTPLFEFHRAHGAHLVPFAGWEMPLYFSGILEEHRAVRSSVGLFDVSHMGILALRGGTVPELLSRRTTANVTRLVPGQCKYAFWLDADGRILDDLLVSRLDAGNEGEPAFLAVPNASKADRILELLHQHRKPDASLLSLNERAAILAVQGPGSRALLERLFPWRLGGLAFYHARRFAFEGEGAAPSEGEVGFRLPGDLAGSALVSRTGYTGELGYELIVDGGRAAALAERLVAGGASLCGLGARDTLRLEKGYLLSGQDFQRDRSPLEAGQERFVELDHEFVGREALERQRKEGLKQRLTGIEVTVEGAIPRHGTPVFAEGEPAGHLTSGGLSPSLGHGIGLAYLPLSLATPARPLELELRGRRVPARTARLPFYPPRAPNAS